MNTLIPYHAREKKNEKKKEKKTWEERKGQDTLWNDNMIPQLKGKYRRFKMINLHLF